MRKNYDEYSDEELIRLYREGDEDAVEFLLLKHRSIVTAKASNYYLKGGERDDLLQIGMIGLMRAVWNFKEEKDTSFVTFANKCVDRALISGIDCDNSNKNSPLNDRVSPEANGESEKWEMTPFMIQNLGMQDPEEAVLQKERMYLFQRMLTDRLSKSEKQVFYLLVQELNYKEIAEVLKKTPKSVDNTLTRIKGKAKLCLQEIKNLNE